jgi:AmmeMemoRadiSam system protein B
MEQNQAHKPRLRAIEAIPIEQDGQQTFCLRDPTGESEKVLFVPETTMWMLARLDGTRDLADLQAEICRASGEIVPRAALEQLVEQLEEASFLDSPAFRERKRKSDEAFAQSPSRASAFAGTSYEADPGALTDWIEGKLGHEPGGRREGIRAVVAPHIDPQRGASVYASAYRALRGCTAKRIVILGISHMGGELPYATIRKDYETPLGPCPVDHPFLERLHEGLPFDPLADQRLHRREHSIEFQAVFLRHVLDGWEDKRIVPILCCFSWFPEHGERPVPYPETWRKAFVERLAGLIDEQTLVVAGVDFAHLGARFGDTGGNVQSRSAEVEAHDSAIMDRIADGDLAGFRAAIARTNDAYRICGYPALVTLLEILREVKGERLDYGQSIEEQTDSLVSFGAMILR